MKESRENTKKYERITEGSVGNSIKFRKIQRNLWKLQRFVKNIQNFVKNIKRFVKNTQRFVKNTK